MITVDFRNQIKEAILPPVSKSLGLGSLGAAVQRSRSFVDWRTWGSRNRSLAWVAVKNSAQVSHSGVSVCNTLWRTALHFPPRESSPLPRERVKSQPRLLNPTSFFDSAPSPPIQTLSLLLALTRKQTRAAGGSKIDLSPLFAGSLLLSPAALSIKCMGFSSSWEPLKSPKWKIENLEILKGLKSQTSNT